MNDDDKRLGSWVQARSGKQFHPLDPRPKDVDIEDIAWSLSNLCRFTGHTNSYYSVGQHSVLCSYVVSPEAAMLALLHDASEAYLGDIARPWKQHLRVIRPGCSESMESIGTAEMRLLDVILAALGVCGDLEAWAEVEQADLLLLVTEARDLMSPLHPEWLHCEANGYPVLREKIVPWTPAESRERFMARYTELKGSKT